MKKGETGPVITVTVLRSQALARPDGRTAILLETREQVAIAFEVTLETIPLLRQELARAEQILRAQPGRA